MITPDIRKKIQEFVVAKPRTIQEVAHHIGKNWRTADAYVERIAQESGVLATRTFREGTRGALKIVYWASVENMHGSAVQERLLEEITAGREKHDFSAFDIYQYVDDKKKEAFLEDQEEEPRRVFQPLMKTLRSAQKQVLIFSGNFSWAHLEQDGVRALEVLGELAKRGVVVKIICDVDLFAFKNAEAVLALNKRLGNVSVEMRHCKQPLRAFVIDHTLVRFKDYKTESKGKINRRRTFVFYTIYDHEWIEWIEKVFWHLFSSAISAETRMKELKSIGKIDRLK
jgi:hypothetical protein